MVSCKISEMDACRVQIQDRKFRLPSPPYAVVDHLMVLPKLYLAKRSSFDARFNKMWMVSNIFSQRNDSGVTWNPSWLAVDSLCQWCICLVLVSFPKNSISHYLDHASLVLCFNVFYV